MTRLLLTLALLLAACGDPEPPPPSPTPPDRASLALSDRAVVELRLPAPPELVEALHACQRELEWERR